MTDVLRSAEPNEVAEIKWALSEEIESRLMSIVTKDESDIRDHAAWALSKALQEMGL